MKRLLITVGGTGGHIFPAMALQKQLAACRSDVDCLFVGGNLSANRYFDAKSISYQSVSCSTLSFKRPWTLPLALGKISRGIIQSRNIIHDFKPDLVIGFGSYYTFPTLMAAKLLGTPFILHEANAIPGRVNRLMAPYAHATATHFPMPGLPSNTVEVEMPLRFKRGDVSRKRAFEYFGFQEGAPVLLIFGGSQGAKTLNRVMKTTPSCQVIHLTGDNISNLPEQYHEAGITACVKAFEANMAYAWEIADAVICRAGASTIAEILEYEVPALLIPFPRATDNHQEKNARFISDTIGGGVTLPEHELDDASLDRAVAALLAQRQAMREQIITYKKGMKRPEFVELVTERLDNHG